MLVFIKQMQHYDLIIVGAGLVGLATAREYLRRRPGLRLLVVEKEPRIAAHQSGHNSGVLHTGIYYTPGSLKARACVAGHRAMLAFCREHGIPFQLCGKVIVALTEEELPRLQALYERGQRNGVQGLELIGPERLREIEPAAAGLRAIYSPNTGIVDFTRVAAALAEEITAHGADLRLSCQVVGLLPRAAEVVVQTRSHPPTAASQSGSREEELTARAVITCAGLYSDRLARLTGDDGGLRIVPFRGDYYVLRPEKRQLVRGLIYPVPDPRFPFLGVHLTLRPNGEVWVGPNAVLALAREGYGRWQLHPRELWETLSYGGFWRLARRYWRMGLAELYRDYVKRAYVRQVQRYVPALRAEDLLPGPSGVRAQALAPDGSLVDDFVIRRGQRVLHVQNAPSPAATSSLVIAQMIVDEAQAQFAL
ncbi:L-2-hydroxyglutarate oxidase [Thermogemmatispora sp.]|uniref:L-2-hydroxyglutarate oxidase n=1 Tax=Thermogemmatispora sp. TaxID=1968838 RepID=UPI0026138CB5|nr:L-2-hydroxyglutarate oxidase [Thermogemmatispora sp.]